MYILNSRLFLTYPKPSRPYIEQLMNEAKYLMKNYGDRGWCYPSRPYAEADNTLRDLYNSSYDTKAEFINCFIVHSK